MRDLGTDKNVPPKLAQRFLLKFLRDDLAEEVLGDLEEKFYAVSKDRSVFGPGMHYWYEVFNYLRPFAIQKSRVLYINSYDMFQSYFKIGWRNILKYKAFSFINVSGLALAMSVCMLIILMLVDQKSYDQFHEKKDRTYRILSKRPGSKKPNASSPVPLANTIKNDYPIVEETTTLILGVGGDAIYEQKSVEMRGFFAEPTFFNVFSFELENGNRDKALESPNSIVITSQFAHLLFGDENPIGKTIEVIDRGLGIINRLGGQETPPVRWGSYNITGVIADKKYKSHLRFDVLVSSSSRKVLQDENKVNDISLDWATYSQAFTYVVVRPGTVVEDLRTSLNEIATLHYKGSEHLKDFKLIEQKLTSITPGIFVGNPASLSLPIEVYYFLSLLVIVIMLSACLNYVYLSTARSLTRAKEIGVRKVVGATKKSLVFQFLSESTITAFLSMLMASVILFLFLNSAFLNLWVNQYLSFDLHLNMQAILIFIGFSILIGLVAGAYPALFLSKCQPIQALKGIEMKRPGKFSFGVRKIVNVSQLIISLLFITTSIVIFKQFKHFTEFNYEFNARGIVNIPLQSNDYRLLATELASVPGVEKISACSFIPATGMSHGAQIRKMGSQEEFVQSEILHVDENFFGNLEIEIVAGRNLSFEDQSSNHCVVNEAAVKALGFKSASEITGESLDYGGGVVVIGVVKNFRFKTPMMQDGIGPLVLSNRSGKFNFINVKVSSVNLVGTIERLKEKWVKIDPVHPFMFKLFEDELKNANQVLGDVVSIIGYISFLAITIACLGLLGMAIYTTQRRTKEVAIRKVLGAADYGLAVLLSRQFLKLLIVSVLVSAPLSYYINNLWLQNFPNRVDFGFNTVLTGSFILLSLGLFTIGSQTIRASKRNPADDLKIE